MGTLQIRVVEPYVVESKPATEWLMGEPVQKVSPRYSHALLQRIVAERLGAWAEGRGRVGTEWRIWLTPPGDVARYFVPDVAYISYARLPRAARSEAEEPAVAPDVVVEIRSPEDRNVHVLHKVDVYLRSGTTLVVIIDPQKRTCVLHDVECQTSIDPTAVLRHPALADFAFDLGALFARLDAGD